MSILKKLLIITIRYALNLLGRPCEAWWVNDDFEGWG